VECRKFPFSLIVVLLSQSIAKNGLRSQKAWSCAAETFGPDVWLSVNKISVNWIMGKVELALGVIAR